MCVLLLTLLMTLSRWRKWEISSACDFGNGTIHSRNSQNFSANDKKHLKYKTIQILMNRVSFVYFKESYRTSLWCVCWRSFFAIFCMIIICRATRYTPFIHISIVALSRQKWKKQTFNYSDRILWVGRGKREGDANRQLWLSTN